MANQFGNIDNVVLTDYNPNYPLLFEREKQLLLQLLPNCFTSVEHFGSTAIAGIKSKPVIDIQAGLSQFPLSDDKIAILVSNGYVYWADNPNPHHQFFFKGMPRTHHLHLFGHSNSKLREHILFRDYLRQHIDVALAYEKLKLKLAVQYHNDREAYTTNKAEFITAVLRKCS